MRIPYYLGYGSLLLGLLGFAEYRGWSLMRVNEARNDPRSVRQNPGSYRPIYGYYPHRLGGK